MALELVGTLENLLVQPRCSAHEETRVHALWARRLTAARFLSPEVLSHLQEALVSSPFLSWLTSFIQRCLHIRDLGKNVVGGQLTRQS